MCERVCEEGFLGSGTAYGGKKLEMEVRIERRENEEVLVAVLGLALCGTTSSRIDIALQGFLGL